MNEQPVRHPLYSIWATLKQKIGEERRVLVTSMGVASFVIFLRFTSILQSWELAALDLAFRWRPPEPRDERVVIVGIDEAALQQYGFPIPDAVMAKLLPKLHAAGARVIGLDIYRSQPVEPGHAELKKVFAELPNLVVIEKIAATSNLEGIAPPTVVNPSEQVGFSNLILDSDGKVRRSFLYWYVDGKARKSFALQLARAYLKAEGITSQLTPGSDYLKLGKAVFQRFEENDGGYVNADTGGYQILANYRGPSCKQAPERCPFRLVSLVEVLEERVPLDWLRDRVILIGSTAPSLKDVFSTPYSTPQLFFGVEIHAHFVSQILSAVLDGRALIHVWPEPLEWVWIFVWSWIGAALSWRVRSPKWFILSLALAAVVLTGSYYLAFLVGWWLPFVPPFLALGGSALAIVSHFAYLEQEWKKSKEFLSTVINTIPDPVFVKDKNHRWIILNQAYCQFIGYPFEQLIEKSEREFFPQSEVDFFWEQDKRVFESGKEHESEEKFTDARGNTHLIATKRSLHRDAAGNIFLVGVIRDITERKRMEEELKRTAIELARYNEELKLSEDRLRYLAYHDPLTGLPNRKLFYERLSQALEWASINRQLVALMFVDLDGFKNVNDTLGHEMGDLLLKAVATRLTSSLRVSDTVARLGGDEFTVILPGIPTQKDAATVAEKILNTLSTPFLIEGCTISVSASIGLSLYPLHASDADSLINKADAAMYVAKELGKNRYQAA
ncbi:MAG: CHASE2 domain-containing protein [Oscillatoriaceae bacterium SKW80]|nr:CHASE2 domain-containing protein [Oscillatoriaceae bacterium SKYG93]MCX8119646.1 CHASE2 domain-containing protein [Oscillatoriaceae bacterium SKW80]MDW8455113.1 CHASE2 domain-containing protein [Oscillatoriaceae cyanobacterium SKYGB_i_bin93]HIK28113.1 CHASE2 domain-containing protein [Oscillatoriaceae cyanobacterium M7585_C2015_266]